MSHGIIDPYETSGSADLYPFTKGQNRKIIKLLGVSAILLATLAVPQTITCCQHVLLGYLASTIQC